MIRRRGFLLGLLAAPAIIRTPGLLMPIKPFVERLPIVDVKVTLLPPTDWSKGVLTRNGLFIVPVGANKFRVVTLGAGGGGGRG